MPEHWRIWRGFKYRVYPTGYVYDSTGQEVMKIAEQPVLYCIEETMGNRKPSNKKRRELDALIDGYPASFCKLLGIKE